MLKCVSVCVFGFQPHILVFLLLAIELVLHQINLLLCVLLAQLGIIQDLIQIIQVFFQCLPCLFLIIKPANIRRNSTIIHISITIIIIISFPNAVFLFSRLH